MQTTFDTNRIHNKFSPFSSSSSSSSSLHHYYSSFSFSSSLSLCVSKKSGLTWKSAAAAAEMAEEGNGKIFRTMFWLTFSPSYASSIPFATCPRFANLGMQPALIPFSGKRWNWIYIIASLSNQICLLPGWLGLIILVAWTTFSSRLWLSTVVI